MDIPVRATLWYARSQRWGFHLYPCSSARQTWIDPNRSLKEGKWERMASHVEEHCSGVYTVTAIEVAHKAIRWSWRTLWVGLLPRIFGFCKSCSSENKLKCSESFVLVRPSQSQIIPDFLRNNSEPVTKQRFHGDLSPRNSRRFIF